jgi:polysaccharide export outer membrane protein
MNGIVARQAALLLSCAGLAGCAALPSAGPTAGEIAKQAVRIETVTPEAATAAWQQRIGAQQQQIDATLAALAADAPLAPVRLYPGTRLDVTLWTAPQWIDLSGGDVSAKPQAATKMEMGRFTIDDAGDLTLPFVGTVHMAGLDLNAARQLLDQRFARTGRFLAPQAVITVAGNARQQIVINGAANHPTVIDWRAGGVRLAEAISQAGGNVIYEQQAGRALSANHAVIVRRGKQYDLPLKAALEADVPLQPGDQVLLEHQAAVNIQCLGGGWTQNTVQAFDEIPTLSRVVATGGGLGLQQAQGRSVFVLSADRQLIRRFNWDTLSGIQAAQAYPLQDGDIVYVANAPIVRIQQVTNILFSAAYPVSTAKMVY